MSIPFVFAVLLISGVIVIGLLLLGALVLLFRSAPNASIPDG
jgi:hypothetical protein